MKGSYTAHLEDLDVHDATPAAGSGRADPAFGPADLTAFCRLDELGLEVTGQRLEPGRAVLACRVVPAAGSDDRWCRECGCEGVARDTVVWRLAHEPFGWRPTTLLITVRRHRCNDCGHVWRQDTSRAAAPRAKLSRRALRWALEALGVQHLTDSPGRRGPRRRLEHRERRRPRRRPAGPDRDPHRVDDVAVIGVDEHVWRHTRRGDTYVTVIIDLTAIRAGTGPARLLNMVEGRSKQAFKTWLEARPKTWRDGIEVVAMDGFTGFKTATTEELPTAVPVMDPFHVVRLAGDALDRCRRRVQQRTHGHRGRAKDPLYRARRTLHTGADLLTDNQNDRLTRLFDTDIHGDGHVEVEATWGRLPGHGRRLPPTAYRLPPTRPGQGPRPDGHAHREHRRSSGPSLTGGCVVRSAQPVLRPPPTPTQQAIHFPRSSVMGRHAPTTRPRRRSTPPPRSPQVIGPGRASPVPAVTVRTFRAPHAGEFLAAAHQALHRFHGLHPGFGGSALPCPAQERDP